MSRITAFGLAWLLTVSTGFGVDPAVIVELVPDNPGPYTGGEAVTVDIWLHSEVDYYAEFDFVQLDFRDSNSQLDLAPTIAFDYSTLDENYYEEGTRVGVSRVYGPPLLPVPFTENAIALFCPPPCGDVYFSITPQGSFHIASINVTLPESPGTYRLDLMNGDDPASYSGAILAFQEGADPRPTWRANSGEITGGALDFVVMEPIPAASSATLAALAMLLFLAATMILVRRNQSLPKRSRVCLWMLQLAALNGGMPSYGLPVCSEIVSVSIDSGYVSASGSGSEPLLIFSDSVHLDDRNWLRLHFSVADLSGSGASASFIRLESALDSDEQILYAADLIDWGDTSAYFSGDEVLVQLWAVPGTGNNRVAVDSVLTDFDCEEQPEGGTEGVCGTDDRQPSDDPRIARIRYAKDSNCSFLSYCTAFLFDNHSHAVITANHCCNEFAEFSCDYPAVVEFNVSPGQQYIPPAPIESQYPIGPQIVHGDVGVKDWCVLGLRGSRNPLIGQGGSFRLASVVPAPSSEVVSVTGHPRGFGQLRGDGHRLPLADEDGPYPFRMRYDADMEPGQSGGPVHIPCGLAFGINVKKGCQEGGLGNAGVKADFEELIDAITPNLIDGGAMELQGSAADCNRNGVKDWCDVACSHPLGNCSQPCGTSEDCNGNLTPDECEPDTDWNNNSIADICDIANGTAPDCNFNFVIDGKDIADGFSEDHTQNGVPDECAPVQDCNQNGREDICDIAILENCDQNENAIPDECEMYVQGACCMGNGCIQLTQCTCELRGGQYAGGACRPWTCNAYGPMP